MTSKTVLQAHHLVLSSLQLPVLVSDLDLECKMWIKLRLAPMCPYIGSISLAFVGAPNVRVQLLPYNRVRVMRIPILQVSIVPRSLLLHLRSASLHLSVPTRAPLPKACTGKAIMDYGNFVRMQAFLTKLLTVDLPGLIVLPKRLDINIPPAVTAVAEAAVGRDAVMRAVASAVLQVRPVSVVHKGYSNSVVLMVR